MAMGTNISERTGQKMPSYGFRRYSTSSDQSRTQPRSSRGVAAVPKEPVMMEGPLRKRGGRVNMWYQRYFILRGSRLIVSKQKGEAVRREYTLMAGCYVSDIVEVPHGSKKASLYEFRLHWPDHITNFGNGTAVSASGGSAYGNNGSSATVRRSDTADLGTDYESDEDEGTDARARLAESTAKKAKNQKTRAAEIERSEIQHASTMSKRATAAGVALGGAVLVGALTAGIGLPVYLALVGAGAAVAGGGAVALTTSHTSSSKVVLAAETEADAMRWKAALEQQIAVLEGRRPPPPAQIPLEDMDRWIRSTSWRGAGVLEGLRVLQEVKATKLNKKPLLCRKAQAVLQSSPIKVFRAHMQSDSSGDSRGMRLSVVPVVQIDDHTDVVRVVIQPGPQARGLPRLRPRDFCVMRYWRLDDDGAFVICLNSVKQDCCPEVKGFIRGQLSAVTVIAPRKDYADFEEDLSEALITCIVEVDPRGLTGRFSYTRHVFSDILLTQVVDVKETLELQRFKTRGITDGGAPHMHTQAHAHAHTTHRHSISSNSTQQPPAATHSKRTSASLDIIGSPSSYAHHMVQHSGSVGSALKPPSPLDVKSPSKSLRSRFRKKRRYYLQFRSTAPAHEEEQPQQQLTPAALRTAISAKEYEMHRLEMEIGRSGGVQLTSKSRERSFDMLKQLQGLLIEVERLKTEYRTLTGRDWSTPHTVVAQSPTSSSAALAAATLLHTPTGSLGGGGSGRGFDEQLDFDDDEGVPQHWLTAHKMSQQTASTQAQFVELCVVLIFCSLFFLALSMRRLFV